MATSKLTVCMADRKSLRFLSTIIISTPPPEEIFSPLMNSFSFWNRLSSVHKASKIFCIGDVWRKLKGKLCELVSLDSPPIGQRRLPSQVRKVSLIDHFLKTIDHCRENLCQWHSIGYERGGENVCLSEWDNGGEVPMTKILFDKICSDLLRCLSPTGRGWQSVEFAVDSSRAPTYSNKDLPLPLINTALNIVTINQSRDWAFILSQPMSR